MAVAVLAMPGAADAASVSATVVNNSYNPEPVTVDAGDTVTWTNIDPVAHTVTADDFAYGSGTMVTSQQYTTVFREAGTFPYHCDIYPSMKGV